MTKQFEGTHLSSRAEPYPMPPLTYENNRMLAIIIRTSQEVLAELVPEPLAANPDGQMIIYIGALNAVSPVRFGYHEAGIMIPATDGREQGVYMPVLYLDKSMPIVIGREVWGYPKYQAELRLQEEAGVVHASVVSEETPLIDAELRLGEPVPPPIPSPGIFFLMKRVPSATGPSVFDVKQLVTAVLRDEIQQEVRPGEAKLCLGSTETDPLERIPVFEVVKGIYFTGGSSWTTAGLYTTTLLEDSLQHRHQPTGDGNGRTDFLNKFLSEDIQAIRKEGTMLFMSVFTWKPEKRDDVIKR